MTLKAICTRCGALFWRKRDSRLAAYTGVLVRRVLFDKGLYNLK